MPHLHILRDSREKKPWLFDDFDASVSDETINTGDYTLAELCRHDPEKDTYYPRYSIERKSGSDFLSSITSGRERFKREIKRATDWESPLLVVIEESRSNFKHNRGSMQYRNLTSSQGFGTVTEWEKYYNVAFRFARTRNVAQEITYNNLQAALGRELIL